MFIMLVGAQARMTVTAKDQDNGIMAVPIAPVWASSDPTIVTVNDTGIVTAVTVGQCDVTVTSGEVVGTVAVEVKNPVLTSLSLTPVKI